MPIDNNKTPSLPWRIRAAAPDVSSLAPSERSNISRDYIFNKSTAPSLGRPVEPMAISGASSAPTPIVTAPVVSNEPSGSDIPTVTNTAAYSSPTEKYDWVTRAGSHGYFGTVDDAINAVNTNPNDTVARMALTDFVNNANQTNYQPRTPGLFGMAANALGITPEAVPNVTNAATTLDQSYTQPGSFDYRDTVTPSNESLETLNTGTTITSNDISAGTVTVAPPALNPVFSDFSSDSGGDDNHSFDTTTSSGYAGDTLSAQQQASDEAAAAAYSGDGDGGGSGGTYCCTASVKQKVMSNKELYALHKWHHSQSTWWINGYDIWGKWVAKNLVSKNKYFAYLTKAFYNWKVNNKFTFKALQAAAIIYPGVIIASLLKGESLCQQSQQ